MWVEEVGDDWVYSKKHGDRVVSRLLSKVQDTEEPVSLNLDKSIPCDRPRQSAFVRGYHRPVSLERSTTFRSTRFLPLVQAEASPSVFRDTSQGIFLQTHETLRECPPIHAANFRKRYRCICGERIARSRRRKIRGIWR